MQEGGTVRDFWWVMTEAQATADAASIVGDEDDCHASAVPSRPDTAGLAPAAENPSQCSCSSRLPCDCASAAVAPASDLSAASSDSERWPKVKQRGDLRANGQAAASAEKQVGPRHSPDAPPTGADSDPGQAEDSEDAAFASGAIPSNGPATAPSENGLHSPSEVVLMDEPGELFSSTAEITVETCPDESSACGSVAEPTAPFGEAGEPETSPSGTPASSEDDSRPPSEATLSDDAVVPSTTTTTEITAKTCPDESSTEAVMSNPRSPPGEASDPDKSPSGTSTPPERNGETPRSGRDSGASCGTFGRTERTGSTPFPVQVRSLPRRDWGRSKREVAATSSSSSEPSSSSDSDSEESSEEEERVYCPCGAPNTDRMIGCDGPSCAHEWFHFKCMGINPRRVPRGKWFCADCEAQDPAKKKVSTPHPKRGKGRKELEKACQEVLAKTATIESASADYGIAVGALSKCLFSRPVLTDAEEKRLVELAVGMCKRGRWPAVREAVLSNVRELLDSEEKAAGTRRAHPFVNNLPNDIWWDAFLKRHPKIQRLGRKYLSQEPTQKPSHDGNKKASPIRNNSSSWWKDSPEGKQRNRKALHKIKWTHKRNILKRRGSEKTEVIPLKKQTVGVNQKQEYELNALQCLEAIIVKKHRQVFQERFRSEDESDSDLLYSAWLALRRLYRGSAGNKQDESNLNRLPPHKGDIPPWSPFHRGPFYVPNESSKTSLSLVIGEPGLRRTSKVLSRIASMRVKARGCYLEPWRHRLHRGLAVPSARVPAKRKRKNSVPQHFDCDH